MKEVKSPVKPKEEPQKGNDDGVVAEEPEKIAKVKDVVKEEKVEVKAKEEDGTDVKYKDVPSSLLNCSACDKTMWNSTVSSLFFGDL